MEDNIISMQKLITLWTLSAYQTLTLGSSLLYDQLASWIMNVCPTAIPPISIAILSSLLLVTADAYSAGPTFEKLPDISAWIEAYHHLIESTFLTKQLLPTKTSDNIMRTCLRFAAVITKKPQKNHAVNDAILEKILDIIHMILQRYPSKAPVQIQKAIQSLSSRFADDKENEEIYEHLKGHELFMNVI